MTTGKRLAAAVVLSAAPLLVTMSAHANIAPQRECLRAPCVAPTVMQTTARFVRAFEAHGWTCSHVTGRDWECATYAPAHR